MSQAFNAVKAEEEHLLCRSYSRYPLAIARGKGARLWDVDGKEYVDLLAGIAWRAWDIATTKSVRLWNASPANSGT